MLESNWVRVCELEERSLNVSHCCRRQTDSEKKNMSVSRCSDITQLHHQPKPPAVTSPVWCRRRENNPTSERRHLIMLHTEWTKQRRDTIVWWKQMEDGKKQKGVEKRVRCVLKPHCSGSSRARLDWARAWRETCWGWPPPGSPSSQHQRAALGCLGTQMWVSQTGSLAAKIIISRQVNPGDKKDEWTRSSLVL